MRAFLIAGEPSGDKLGAALIAGLRELTQVDLQGIAGPLMQGQGMDSLFPLEELSVMGIAEVLPKYRHLKRRIRETAEKVIDTKPDVLITIDSPDFCLRVARLVKAANPSQRIVHYVAPTVWAWRPKRAQKMAETVDQVLALLPFEPPYFEKVGLQCDFVGHPVAVEPVPTDAQVAAFRQTHGLGDAQVILALPGSRRAEISRLADPFGLALRELVHTHPDARVVLPTLPHLREEVTRLTADWPAPLILTPDPDEKRTAFAAADIALAASGTVSLELAAVDTPMVVAYDMNWISWQIMSRMALIDTVTLVNLVTGRKTVAEFLGPDCQSAPIAAALATLLDEPSARATQRQAMADAMAALGRGQERPGLRAARAILAGLPSVS
ncbi:lipid-A-disaccharide synthase [Aliiroseovarius sp. PTFE2010]|uniref:lipid-A-disaccharide synthase n=1 Tax=Aliiroseovarius sp. PTFE2010 TaxID=3417190 RepID=UPI003CF147CE